VIETPWALYPYLVANSSFNEAVAVPVSDPSAGPFFCAPISQQWLLVALGCLDQLRQPCAWQVTTELEVSSIMAQVDAFIAMVATASMCDERGIVSVTIAAASAAGSTTVTFPFAFTVTPIIVCSCDNPVLLASPTAASSTGFTANLTANVPVVSSVTANLLWIAGPAT
jgi:hypothetical protein